MNRGTTTHQVLPIHLQEIADQIQRADIDQGTVKRSRAEFLSIVRKRDLDSSRLNIPIDELPDEHLPAIYFAEKSGKPVIIQERLNKDQFTVRLWDDRISIFDKQKLIRLLAPTGYTLTDKQTERIPLKENVSKWKSFLKSEKQQIALGAGASIISVSIFALFIYLLNFVFSQTLTATESTTPILIGLGFVSAVMCCLAFLQIRNVLASLVHRISQKIRSKQQAMPPAFPLRAAWNPTTTREWIEVACVPFILSAAALVLNWSPQSVAAWSTFFGCSVIAVVFAFAIPRLVELFFNANNHISKKPRAEPSELISTDGRVPILQTNDLYLSHPNKLECPLVNRLTLKIYPGERIGLIGLKASDSSVLLRVLTNEIKPELGSVKINRELTTIGWFGDKAALINGTLGDNLYPNQAKQPTSEQIERALELSGLSQSKIYLDSGLNRTIDEAGKLIDLETRTRLILARSLVNRPDLLIYDMPMNPELEPIVLEVLGRVMEAQPDVTLIIGAKRGTQLVFTTRSILLRNGEELLQGSTEFVLENFENEIRKNTSM